VRRLFVPCLVLYLALYAFEGLVRWGLYLVHLDSAILARDMLIAVPLLVLLVQQGLRNKIDPAYPAFGAVLLIHGIMSVMNLHMITPVIYGAKLLINVLFGMVAAPLLLSPSRRVTQVFLAIWVVSVLAVIADKAGTDWPWTGLSATIGGVNVDVAHDWEITDAFQRRAAGLARSSISMAMLMPVLALVLCFRTRAVLIRAFLLLVTIVVVFMTTQKGSLFAFVVVAACVLLPGRLRMPALRTACVAFAVLCIVAPIATEGLLMNTNAGGVFSASSFAMRVTDTWPRAFEWIRWNDNFPFGVGLGGIGGAQRLYAPTLYNPSDNLFIFLYAFFGLFGVAYLLGLALMALRTRQDRVVAEPTLAVLAFMLGYGVVLSMIEDQVAALCFGAAIGALWQRHNEVDWSHVPKPKLRNVLRRPGRLEPVLGQAYVGRRP
jgi:hypothetical protein